MYVVECPGVTKRALLQYQQGDPFRNQSPVSRQVAKLPHRFSLQILRTRYQINKTIAQLYSEIKDACIFRSFPCVEVPRTWSLVFVEKIQIRKETDRVRLILSQRIYNYRVQGLGFIQHLVAQVALKFCSWFELEMFYHSKMMILGILLFFVLANDVLNTWMMVSTCAYRLEQ